MGESTEIVGAVVAVAMEKVGLLNRSGASSPAKTLRRITGRGSGLFFKW